MMDDEDEEGSGNKPPRYKASRTYTNHPASPTGVENNYFSPMTYTPRGYAEGGEVGESDKIINEAVAAIQNAHPDPTQAISHFVDTYGWDAFTDLVEDVSNDGQNPLEADEAQPPGPTDTEPAMLTPGEFVVNRSAAQKHMPLLEAINETGLA